MLCLADGSRSVDQLIADCQAVIAPQTASRDAVLRFFTAAYAAGIVLVDGAGCHQVQPSPAGRSWWQNPLAVRLPGIDPNRQLDRLVEFLQPIISPVTLIVVVIGMIVGLGISLTYFDQLALDLSTAWPKLKTGQGLMTLLVVVALTKIIHELAHAIACKYFGGDVLEMGVMFLFGVPCLYCDASDAWLLDQRWKRVLVSAAGMLAELAIASVLSIVWLFSTDGRVQDVCVIVMAVCSVTTVLLNGNPLLRYDGYFILADLAGIPNLATESAAQVRSWIRRLLWGLDDHLPSDRPMFVGLYGIVSSLYRIWLYSMIAWVFYKLAQQYQLDRFYSLIVATAFILILWKWVRLAVARPAERESASRSRPIAIAVSLAGSGWIIGLIPLPHSVTAPMLIEPAAASQIFVTRPGRMVDALQSGSTVDVGTVIARLENPESELELAASRAECNRLQVQLQSLRQSRATNGVSSTTIESIQRAHLAAEKRLAVLEKNAGELELRSPCRGKIYATRTKNPISTISYQAKFWADTPIDLVNRGAWLESGTVVCIVGQAAAREATVLLRQEQVDLVGCNQIVSIRLADYPRGRLTGRVIDVSVSPAEKIPDELMESAETSSNSSPSFLVRVRLDDVSLAVPIRTIGHAKIYVDRQSIWRRITRFLADAFG